MWVVKSSLLSCIGQRSVGRMTMEQAKNTHHWGKDHCTACLQFYKFGSSCFTTYNKQHIFSALTRLYLTKQKKICCLDVCSKAVESKLVKLETTRTVIMPPPTVNVLWGKWRCTKLSSTVASSAVCSPKDDRKLHFAILPFASNSLLCLFYLPTTRTRQSGPDLKKPPLSKVKQNVFFRNLEHN